MTVFSALFEKIAARIPDAATAKELLAEGQKADPIPHELPRRADYAASDAKTATTNALSFFVSDVYALSHALQKMKVNLTLSAEQVYEENPDDIWNDHVTGATVKLMQGDTQLMSFKVSANDAVGYFIEAEENSGGGGISLAMIQNGPAADIAEVEEKLAKHLDSSFRIPAEQAAPVLQRLIETVDYRPAAFLDLIKTAPFEKVLDFVNAGINTGHVYDEYPGNFLPLDWVLMSRHAELDAKNQIAPFTVEQRRELFEAIVAQAKDLSQIHSDMTMQQAALNNVSELIPRLVEIGARPHAGHFIDAGGHSLSGRTLETLKVLRPYVANVNTNKFGNTAGANAAYRADLESFKWLETKGLDKTATGDNNFRSYAHALVASSYRQTLIAAGQEDRYPAMLHHLIDNGYDFKSAGPAGTPVQMAVENGNLDLAKILIEAGATPDSSLMLKLLTPVFYGSSTPGQKHRVSSAEAAEFMTYLHEQHAVPYTQAVADAPMALLQSVATYNFFKADFDGLKPLAEVINFLAAQGAVPAETDALKAFRLESAEKLRGIDAETAKAFGIEALPALPRGNRLRRTPSP